MTAPVTGSREHGFEPHLAITPFIDKAKPPPWRLECPQPPAEKAGAAAPQTELHRQSHPRLHPSALDAQHEGQWKLLVEVGDGHPGDPTLRKTRKHAGSPIPFL